MRTNEDASHQEYQKKRESAQVDRNFIATILLEAVTTSLGGDNKNRKINWSDVDKARRYLTHNPIAELYFLMLDIRKDAAIWRLQKKWDALDKEKRLAFYWAQQEAREAMGEQKQQPKAKVRVLH